MIAKVLNESEFTEKMQNEIEPYLKEKREEYYLEREKGKKIYVAGYQVTNPRGVVIISHGFLETADKYFEGIYYFMQEGYHVYIADYCGHGRSYYLTDTYCPVHVDTYERYAKDLLFVTQFAKKKHPYLDFFLYGHSMGGGVAATVLCMEPHVFRKAILSSPMIQPKTSVIPWKVAKKMAFSACEKGKEQRFALSQHGYNENETFEKGYASNKERYEYYKKKRRDNACFQLDGASYGWLKSAMEMKEYLLEEGWQHIETPIILFQAEHDVLVSPEAQREFVEKVKGRKKRIKLTRVPGSKHEIYLSDQKILKVYWKKILEFFDEER